MKSLISQCPWYLYNFHFFITCETSPNYIGLHVDLRRSKLCNFTLEIVHEDSINKTIESKKTAKMVRKNRSSHPEVSLERFVLKICSKFAEEHLYRGAILIKLQSNFIEITLRHGCSPANLLHIFRIPFPKNTSGRLLLKKFFVPITFDV